GTLNPHMQTPKSLARYRKLRAKVAAELAGAGIEVIDLPELASEEYADASHPLAEGYRTLADFMIKQLTPSQDKKI
ncbi:MAG: SGNH/GDSL hydrolase family protein, partial [Lentisphaeria bacterium]|nr:SGNH/GDSL hydrolase family protein [Lentisphaeria bacterium]